jgi:outer membrane PBP1 activator LpoA protein
MFNMQRVLLILSTLFALYACTSATVQGPPIFQTPQAEVKITPPATPATTFVVKPAPVVSESNIPDSLPLSIKPGAHIALMLPLESASFGAAAAAVQQGFLAAAGLDPQALPVRVYGNLDENSSVAAVYRQAILDGASAVAGPLTRNGVTALAAVNSFPVPTLSLNTAESTPAHNLYFFGMSIETEAKQVALLAGTQGLKQAIVISADEPLARRLQYAFEEQWTASGGTVLREIDFNGDTSIFADIASTPDTMVFFATGADKARLIHPFLPANMPVYATSQIFSGNANTLINFDLEGIRFVDMPWLMQPEQTYPRANPPLPTDQERLYALGIDAYRLIQVLLGRQTTLPLDGVSGHITLKGHTFERKALPSLFVQGHAQSVDAPIAPTAQMFPGQIMNNVDAASSVAAASAVGAASSVKATSPVMATPKP